MEIPCNQWPMSSAVSSGRIAAIRKLLLQLEIDPFIYTENRIARIREKQRITSAKFRAYLCNHRYP